MAGSVATILPQEVPGVKATKEKEKRPKFSKDGTEQSCIIPGPMRERYIFIL